MLVAIVLAANWCVAAPAETYPAKPIRMIVPTTPGGATDVVARVIAPKLAQALGQPIVIDNRAGAGGTIATTAVAQSPPDGYTLLAVFDSFTSNPLLFKTTTYDALNDFTPLALVAKSAQVVVVPQQLGIERFGDLVRVAKAKGNALNYATAGPGTSSRLTMELLKLSAGIDPTAVHYKGGSPAMTALLAGEVDMMIVTIGTALPYLKSGKLIPLAVTSPTRNSQFPELPTLSDFYPGFEAHSWVGILGPAGMATALIARLNAEIVTALAMPDVGERLRSQGYEVIGSTPEAFREWLRVEAERWGRVIRQQGISLE